MLKPNLWACCREHHQASLLFTSQSSQQVRPPGTFRSSETHQIRRPWQSRLVKNLDTSRTCSLDTRVLAHRTGWNSDIPAVHETFWNGLTGFASKENNSLFYSANHWVTLLSGTPCFGTDLYSSVRYAREEGQGTGSYSPHRCFVAGGASANSAGHFAYRWLTLTRMKWMASSRVGRVDKGADRQACEQVWFTAHYQSIFPSLQVQL